MQKGTIAGAIKWLSELFGRRGVVAMSASAFALGVLTFTLMRLQIDIPAAGEWLGVTLYADIVMLVLLTVMIARKIRVDFKERAHRKKGLHRKLSATLALLISVPALILLAFTLLVFEFGLTNWFSAGVQRAVTSASGVADAYLEENRKKIVADALAFVRFIDYTFENQSADAISLNRWLSFQMLQHGVVEAAIIDEDGGIMALAGQLTPEKAVELAMPSFSKALGGDVVIIDTEPNFGEDVLSDVPVRAIVRLSSLQSVYLLIGRSLDAKAVAAVNETREAVAIYRSQQNLRGELQISYTMVFALISFLLALVSVTVGLAFADRIGRPLEKLARGAKRLQGGELGFQLNSRDDIAEVNDLTSAFNSMSTRLSRQRKDLEHEREERDSRLVFIENLLSSTSSGVLALDVSGRITLANTAAVAILGDKRLQTRNKVLLHLVPEFQPLFDKLSAGENLAHRLVEKVTIARDGVEKTLNASLALLDSGTDDSRFYMLTFDDITEALRLESESIWSDVAQRLAHEIKNPLTPIQLSAERLRHRYLDHLPNPNLREEAGELLEAVLRHVRNIGSMVTEFSSFARMPRQTLGRENLCRICWQSMMIETVRKNITFSRDFPKDPVWIVCDRRQISQVMVNLLENAVDSINKRAQSEGEKFRGKIEVKIQKKANNAVVTVTDNGIGAEKAMLEKAFMPMVSTKTQGGGLGLAIVRRIAEDHKGSVIMRKRRQGKGLAVELKFPLEKQNAKEKQQAQEAQSAKEAQQAQETKQAKEEEGAQEQPKEQLKEQAQEKTKEKTQEKTKEPTSKRPQKKASKAEVKLLRHGVKV